MLLGIVSNPPAGARSERDAWYEIGDTAKVLRDDLYDALTEQRMQSADYRRMMKAVNRIAQVAEQMRVQLRGDGRKAVHVNGRGIKTSDDVQAIVYRHVEDGELYVHGFGDANLELTTKGDKLIIDGLKDDTAVQMFAQPDGSVRIASRDGSPVWEDFD